jgi:hypothetical protein
VVAAGAAPELVEIVVEIDARRNLVRATASGATAAAASGDAPLRAGEAEREAAAERALRRSRPFERTPAGSELAVYSAAAKRGGRDVCIVDLRGIVRATRRDALLRTTPVAEVRRALDRLLEDATTFGDVGRALPEVTLVYRNRVADLGTLAEAGHVLALAEEELRGLPGETTVVMLAARRAV